MSEFGVIAATDILGVVGQTLTRRGVKIWDGVVLDSWRYNVGEARIDNLRFRYFDGDAKETTTTTMTMERVDQLLMLFSFAVKGKDYDIFQVR